MQLQTVFPFKTALLLFLAGIMAFAQQVQQKEKPAEKNPAASMSPASRIATAKTAFLKGAHGNKISFDVVSSALQNWGKFTLVDAPDKADIIIEVSSTGGSPATSYSSFGPSKETGQIEQSSHTTKDLSSLEITLSVYEAKTQLPLWKGTEKRKRAMKKVDKENNQVEAAERLATRFHDFVEPAQKQ